MYGGSGCWRALVAKALLTVALGSAVVSIATERADAGHVKHARLVSHLPGSRNATPNGSSDQSAASADGSVVAFTSTATNLVADQRDTNGVSDVFVRDRVRDTVVLASHSAAGTSTTASGSSYFPSISADGAYVAFVSHGTNFVTGASDTNNDTDVVLFERATGNVTLVSRTAAAAATTGNKISNSPTLSRDGAYISFLSVSSNLVSGQTDTNNHYDVFVLERATGVTALASHTPASATTAAGLASQSQSISGDGNSVLFTSAAFNLVAGQTEGNTESDVFLFERPTGTVKLVSHTPGSTTSTANGTSSGFYKPAISADGGVVAFESKATNLVLGQADTNADIDTFLFDGATGAVTLLSRTPAGPASTGNDASYSTSLSANGSVAAFRSEASNLIPGQVDFGGTNDVFVYERSTTTVRLISHSSHSDTATAAGSSHSPSISPDGAAVVYQSDAANVAHGQNDANGAYDVFVHEPDEAQSGTADFDGNGATDVGVFRPGSGAWMIRGGLTASFGSLGDVPVAGDYNGDGTTEIAVYRPAANVWFVQGGTTAAWGAVGDVPVPGDYDGNGMDEIAVFRPDLGLWFARNGATAAYGTPGDIPVPGDYNGDGHDEPAVFRPATGYWFVESGPVVHFGTLGDIPVPGDYDADGDTEIAVFRPATGAWYFLEGTPEHFGMWGDIPLELPSAIQSFLKAVVG